jgi:hypothetical protein
MKYQAKNSIIGPFCQAILKAGSESLPAPSRALLAKDDWHRLCSTLERLRLPGSAFLL